MAIVKSDIEKVFKAIDVEDFDSINESDVFSNYVWENSQTFIKEWAEGEGWATVPSEVEDEVRIAIEENAQKSVYEHYKHGLMLAITEACENAEHYGGKSAAGAFGEIEYVKGVLKIEIKKPFLRIWRLEVEGQGYSAWGGDEKLSDVKSATFVLNVVNGMAEVYGGKSIAGLYEENIGGSFEPETGRYHELSVLADKAMASYLKQSGKKREEFAVQEEESAEDKYAE